ncbi:MAG: AAA family ATPase [bacterium]|nr:AAA family ATPase [bacterium]
MSGRRFANLPGTRETTRMHIIAVINQKGGCAKTTTAINLSAQLAKSGKRVLLVDTDPQSHCAAGLGIPEQRIEMDVGDAMLIAGHRTIDPAKLIWRAGKNLDLIPSRMRLAALEAPKGPLADAENRELRLRTLLKSFESDYDFVVVDCPPSIGLLTYNSLACADTVLIPVETGFFSLQGATRQVATVKAVAKRLERSPSIWLLPTIHEEHNAIANDLLDEMHRRFKDRVIPVVIRRDSRLREAVSFGQTVVDYAPVSTGAEDYGRLASWMVQQKLTQSVPFADLGTATTVAPFVDILVGPELVSVGTEINEAPAASEPVSAEARVVPGEVKPVSRAEDVARRAQDFLRRVAIGRSREEASTQTRLDQAKVEIDAASMPEPIGTSLRLISSDEIRPQSISPGTQRLLGTRETNQGVLFVQPLSTGTQVSIAGDFNDWNATSHVMKRNTSLGVFELCLKLPQGRHRYRLVIDGQWTADPYNDVSELNPFGEHNSILNVGAGHAAAMSA